MVRAATVLAVVTAAALVAPAAAHADSLSADVMTATLGDWAISSAKADEVAEPKRGFFVGVHSGIIASGVGPEAAGLSVPLNDGGIGNAMANGYYVYTAWDIGTYVGGGFGQLNLGNDPLTGARMGTPEYGYQGMAGLTYSVTPAMALGLEYRYSASATDPLIGAQPLPNEDEESQSVTLRFDFLLN